MDQGTFDKAEELKFIAGVLAQLDPAEFDSLHGDALAARDRVLAKRSGPGERQIAARLGTSGTAMLSAIAQADDIAILESLTPAQRKAVEVNCAGNRAAMGAFARANIATLRGVT